MRIASGVLTLLLASSSAFGAGALNPPTPFLAPAPGDSPGQSALAFASAERAQALGFPSTAVTLLRSLMEEPGADRAGLSLALASTLLDEGDGEGAARVLDGRPGPRGSDWHLRKGLAYACLQRWDAARRQLAAVHLADLSRMDAGWYPFLQGLIEEAPGSGRAGGGLDDFNRAVASAVSELQRARFVLALEQARLRVAKPDGAEVDAARQEAERYQGQKFGYGFAREYAIALNAAGQPGRAVDVLETQLRMLPAGEAAEGDQFRLLLGLIAGGEEGSGRRALFELLASGSDADRQRTALELLFRDSKGGAGHAEFRDRLQGLIDLPEHPRILDSLLLYRAELALGDLDFGKAEECAGSLLSLFPGSNLKAHAFAILAGSAWEQKRFRTAADYAFQARAELSPGLVRSEFGVLVAEAWYREGDYRSAADAYASALKDPPSGVPASTLLYQRALAEIKAGVVAGGDEPLRRAGAILDELAANPAFDPADRWSAEWNLARALESRGYTELALDRVNRVMEEPAAPGLPGDLRARLGWLRVRLSLDAHRPAEALQRADALGGLLGGLPAELSSGLSSNTALLEAQARFDLGQEAEGLAALKDLQARFPGTDAAVYSYIYEADHDAREDKVDEAERQLASVAEKYPDSDYAPYALYQAALQAERLGQDKNLEEADRILESLVTNPDPKYRQSGLIFQARMREGDILRKLNQFPKAEQVYFSLAKDPVNEERKDGLPPNAILAWLALAECHSAQSANDPAHADRAAEIFQDLVERMDAPADVRVEAGYSLGDLLKRQGRPERAASVWWNDVVDAFLIHRAASVALGEKGRYWLARTLLDIGDLYQGQDRLDEAKQAWLLLVRSGLPYRSAAQDRLARFHLPAAGS